MPNLADKAQQTAPVPGTFYMMVVEPGTKIVRRMLISDFISQYGGGGGGGGATPLSTPTLTALVISSTQIDLSWTNVANEIGYILQRSPDNAAWATINSPAADVTAFNDTGLLPLTLYYYRIVAVGDGVIYSNSGYGTDSDTTSAGATGLPHTSPFTAANGTNLTAYTPTAGNGWTHELGAHDIQGNKATASTIISNNAYSVTDLEATEYTITVIIGRPGGAAKQPYLFFLFSDIDNCMFLQTENNDVRLYKIVATVVTLIGTFNPSPSISDAADHTYVLVVGALTCSLTIDGNPVFTGQAVVGSGTKAGIGCTSVGVAPGDVTFDSFNATT